MTDDGLTTAAAAPPREEATTVDATSEPDTASGAGRPRRSRLPLPTPGDALRHAVDAVAAPLTFLVVNDTVGTRVAAVAALGGVAAIVPSHPHMFGMQLAWSAAFDDAPVHVWARDREWLQRQGPAIEFFDDGAYAACAEETRNSGLLQSLHEAL